MIDRISSPWKTATWLLLGFVAIVMLMTALDYGDSWDEQVRLKGGETKLEYYRLMFGGDFKQAIELASAGDNYPGFHDLNLALLRRISPLSDFATGNLFSAFLGFLGILGAIRLGLLIGGYRTAFWTGVLLILLPAWYGHMFINPKDIPFAFGYIWALGFMYEWISRERMPSISIVACLGIFTGITMATRVGGLILVCYLGLFVLLKWISSLRRGNGKPFGKDRLYGFLGEGSLVVIVALLAFVIMLAYWPAGQVKPLGQTSDTLQKVTSYAWNMPVFFNGAFFAVGDLPTGYILKMMLFKIPVVTQLLFFSAVYFLISSSIRHRHQGDYQSYNQLGIYMILFAIVFPVFYVLARGSTLYNGLRHLLFILPPLCALAAWGLMRLNDLLVPSRPRYVMTLKFLFGLGLLLPLVQMIRLHPYQYIYYNELAGGTANASRKFETDYWCTVYRELAHRFYAYLVDTKPTFSKPEVVVNMEHVTWLFTPFLPADSRLPIRVLRSRPQLDDYYAASTAWGADQYYAGTPVVEIQRAGVPLGIIRDRRNLLPEQRELGYTADDQSPDSQP